MSRIDRALEIAHACREHWATLWTGQCRRGQRVAGCSLRRSCWRAVDLLFPPCCLACERLLADDDWIDDQTPFLICRECCATFTFEATVVCPRCAAPMPDAGLSAGCGECRRRKLPFEAALALGEYHGSLRDAVLKTKKAAYESLTLQLGELVARRLIAAGWRDRCDVLVPVPSHWWRRWSRGTSGPELLATVIGQRLDLPVEQGLLRCQRRTRKQGTLLPNERLENVRGAFVIGKRAQVEGRRIMLVDDVMTTGATLREAARLLLKAGARSVRVAVLARGTGETAPSRI
jgi:ComF family protein